MRINNCDINYFGTRNNDDIEQHGEETFDQREHDPNSAISNIFSPSCFDAILPEEPMKQSLTCTISHKPIIEDHEFDVAMNDEIWLKDIRDFLSKGQHWNSTDHAEPIVTKDVHKSTDKPNSELRENIPNIGDFVTGAEPEDQITVNYKDRRLAIKTGVQRDVRLQYISDVFPLNGEQFGIPQSPHYLQDKDGEMHIIIQLPKYYLNRAPLLLRAILLTVCHNGQYYMYTGTFLRDKKNEEIASSNPVYFEFDKPDFLTDGMPLNLALITQKISELKAQQPLRPFNPPENFIHPCHMTNYEQDYWIYPADISSNNLYCRNSARISITLEIRQYCPNSIVLSKFVETIMEFGQCQNSGAQILIAQFP
ncbi:unnamed protein product [Didymodactylos carnosus]|uniref:Uncharacterized protein n=1 Tax=Didymodactylos carnosus TaxID=1234261 RepID=A0A814WCH9_9BILA|nr:unnamed protein product [Didymodactylos carnosus]CAF3964927.1 unnamed protein product [Didymodactylos carnosus]